MKEHNENNKSHEGFLAPIKIEQINWSGDLEQINVGGYSVIYRVFPRLIAKVGKIDPEEVAIQQYLAEMKKALPVLDYSQYVQVANLISKAFCSIHGLRPVIEEDCTCDNPFLDVLLMPEASPLLSEAGLDAFMADIALTCHKLGRNWEVKRQHIALYNGHTIALDFGDPDNPY